MIKVSLLLPRYGHQHSATCHR